FRSTFDLRRLRDLSVSYTLPASWTQRLGASSANILFTVNNLTHWTNYKGRDPMVNTSPVTGNAVIAGPAFGAPREYGVRLRVHFYAGSAPSAGSGWPAERPPRSDQRVIQLSLRTGEVDR